jgi:rubredoxin
MADPIPSVEDLAGEPGTRTCPKCGAIMDRGGLRSDRAIGYAPSSISGWSAAVDLAAYACIACGYVELYTDPVTLRCMLAGVKPPKPGKKPGLL